MLGLVALSLTCRCPASGTVTMKLGTFSSSTSKNARASRPLPPTAKRDQSPPSLVVTLMSEKPPFATPMTRT
jgi:hypothetical protein